MFYTALLHVPYFLQTVALKTAGFAVFGALAGVLVGGPVGLIAGAKIG